MTLPALSYLQKPWAYIIAAIIFVVLLRLISEQNGFDQQEVARSVEENVGMLIKEQEAYLDGFIEEAPSWDYEPVTGVVETFPTYVYKDGGLIYWNENRFVPIIEGLNKTRPTGVLSVHNSRFIYSYRSIAVNGENYDVVSLIPLLYDYKLANKYLKPLANARIFPKNVLPSFESLDSGHSIEWQDVSLFNIHVTGDRTEFEGTVYAYLLVFAFALSLMLLVYVLANRFYTGQWWKGFVVLLIGLAGIRCLMIVLNFPDLLITLRLFDPKVYVSSSLNPSLGDLLLNVIALLLIAIYVFKCRKDITHAINESSIKWIPTAGKILMFGLCLWLLALNYHIVFDILANSQIELDISQNIDFPAIRQLCYLIILLFGVIYFLLVHTAHRVIMYGAPAKTGIIVQIGIPAVVLFVSLELLYHSVLWLVLVYQLLYFFIVFFVNLPRALTKLQFNSILYLLLTIAVLSITWSTSVYKAFEDNEIVNKEKFEIKLLLDRDLEDEFQLEDIMRSIQSDAAINARIMNPQSSPESIVERIKRVFLSGSFNQYHVYIHLFDKDGKPLGDTQTEDILELRKRVEQNLIETGIDNIYYEGDISSSRRRRYVGIITLSRYGNGTGYAVLDFQLKKQVTKSVYPELLLDHRRLEERAFDYAVYINGTLIYTSGTFNYAADFNVDWIEEDNLYTKGVERGGVHHLAAKGANKVLIVSSGVYPTWSMLSNFSFFFLLFSFLVVLVIGANYLLHYRSVGKMNFSTKILLYLGAAFVIPLILVGAATLNTINDSYKKEIDKSHEKETLALSEVLVDLLDSFESDAINREYLAVELTKIAASARTDLNVYDVDGNLLASSQPTIFNLGLVSPYVNPVPLKRIKEYNRNKVILDESVGDLSYKTSYVAIRSFQDGQLLGILGSPYFGSKNHLNRQSTEVFNNIINISTIIFIVSIGFSYVGVRGLTNPIMLIAASLKKTALDEQNQPLEWATNDEIGVLVKEYNSMLEKLEKSKKELARSEKEAAWREMAQQVAHEVKNPLTPMKLTLQHLERTLEPKDSTRKTVKTLLGQIDTMDQIVTSFSHFAKMPDPEKVDFDLRSALENIVGLHPDRQIFMSIEDGRYIVTGDKKLFGRIFNNIILNAFQAMVEQEDAQMVIAMSLKGTQITLGFEDNGPGIPDDIKDKVFIPNFSTKDAGSGIGLAVAKRGIEQAGGAIWFSSNHRGGTTFYIELPLSSTDEKPLT